MYALAFARFVFVVELGAFFQQHIAHDGSNTLVPKFLFAAPSIRSLMRVFVRLLDMYFSNKDAFYAATFIFLPTFANFSGNDLPKKSINIICIFRRFCNEILHTYTKNE